MYFRLRCQKSTGVVQKRDYREGGGGGEIRKVKKTTDYIFFIFLKNLFSAIPHPSRHAHCRHFDQNMCNACCGF